jgi:hypothetical protein
MEEGRPAVVPAEVLEPPDCVVDSWLGLPPVAPETPEPLAVQLARPNPPMASASANRKAMSDFIWGFVVVKERS